jgi:Xaa-Pro aminopeptidase
MQQLSSLFVENRQKLTALTQGKSLILLVSNQLVPKNGDQYYPFEQDSDFYYLCGIKRPNSILALSPLHPNPQLREVLFTHLPTEKDKLWTGDDFTPQYATQISGIQTIIDINKYETHLPQLVYESETIYLNIPENQKLPLDYYQPFRQFAQSIQNQFPLHNYQRLSPLLQMLRLQKSEAEIELLKKAADITAQTFEKICTLMGAGERSEQVLCAQIVKNFAILGAESCSFDPIVASGANACVLHYTQNQSIANETDLLLLDIGAKYEHYAADLSRTIPVCGKFNERQKQVYQSCLNVYEAAKKIYIPGMSIKKIHQKVCDLLQTEMLNLGLFSVKDIENESVKYECVKKYFPHGIAHFIGLDVHDVGDLDIVFDYGMVLSCEPGIYIAEENIGIRIETMMLVNDSPIDLMKNVPVTVEEIENLMSK